MTARAQAGKVLMVSQYLHMGGLERMILNLSSALKDGGAWEPSVFVFDRLPGAAPDNDLGPDFAAAGVAVFSFPKEPGFSFRTVLRLRRALIEGGVSVLHTHDLGALIYGACAKLLCFGRVRLVHTQHSFVHLSRRRAYALYERLFTSFADAIAVVSPDTRRIYEGLGVPAAKVHLIPNGVRFPERAAPDASEKARARAELLGSLEPAARAALKPLAASRWILYLARLHRVKGQDRALEVWARLRADARARCALVFVGPESEAGALDRLKGGIAQAPDAVRVAYAGTTRRPEAWLSAADLSLSCSEFEGLPLGPIEAAGAGLPLVLSDIPGHEAAAAWGERYPLRDADAGARAVERVLAQLESGGAPLAERLRGHAADARSRYSLAAMGEAYSKLYSPEAVAS